MKEEHVEVDEILVSFDVTPLFTNISTNEAVKVIPRKLLKDEDWAPLSPYRIAELL